MFTNRLQGEMAKSVRGRPILIKSLLNNTSSTLSSKNKEEIKQNYISFFFGKIVELKRACKQCKENTKAKLKCGHTICEDCLHNSAYNHFIKNEPYNLSAACFTCKEEAPIGNSTEN